MLYNIVLVWPYINMDLPRVYTCSLSWKPLLPPSSNHSSWISQCTSPEDPVSRIKLVWRIVWQIILYMFQCHYPKSSHPRPHSQSPKDGSIHRCLFCYLTNRFIITIFLNSTYMPEFTLGIFLSGELHSV